MRLLETKVLRELFGLNNQSTDRSPEQAHKRQCREKFRGKTLCLVDASCDVVVVRIKAYSFVDE